MKQENFLTKLPLGVKSCDVTTIHQYVYCILLPFLNYVHNQFHKHWYNVQIVYFHFYLYYIHTFSDTNTYNQLTICIQWHNMTITFTQLIQIILSYTSTHTKTCSLCRLCIFHYLDTTWHDIASVPQHQRPVNSNAKQHQPSSRGHSTFLPWSVSCCGAEDGASWYPPPKQKVGNHGEPKTPSVETVTKKVINYFLVF